MPRKLPVFLILLALAGMLAWFAAPYLSAAAFVLDLSGSTSWVRVVPLTVTEICVSERSSRRAAGRGSERNTGAWSASTRYQALRSAASAAIPVHGAPIP